MDITMIIGLGMVIIFLIAVIITIWRDNVRERRLWQRKAQRRK